MDELRLFCDEHKPRIVTINETWLDDSFTDAEITLPGYNVMRKDRDENGGGVAVYIAEQLNYSRLDESAIQTQNDNFESIWFEVCHPKPIEPIERVHSRPRGRLVMAAALRLRSAVCSIVVYLLVSLIVCKLAECPLKLPNLMY